MPDVSAHPLRHALAKFWAPVPWLLEASIVLEVVLQKYFEASIIAGLLVFNAALAYFQEGRAQATLKALNSRVPKDFAVFASILPEGKFDLVKAFQKNGHTVGMCGDGANDAPALRQAQMGIAVSTATDVAKSAAGIVLTQAGLGGIVAAVKEGRITFQRILTYTLNSVLKKIVQVLLLAIGLVVTGHAVLTPMLMVIVMITGDFLAMALTTDRVRPSPMPNSWQVSKITMAGVTLGGCFLA